METIDKWKQERLKKNEEFITIHKQTAEALTALGEPFVAAPLAGDYDHPVWRLWELPDHTTGEPVDRATDTPRLYIQVDGYSNAGKIQVDGGWPFPAIDRREKCKGGRATMSPRGDLSISQEKELGLNQYGSVSINVSKSRGPEAWAKDIKRRLLPDYRKLWQALIETRTLRQANLDHKADQIERARELMKEHCDEVKRAGMDSVSAELGGAWIEYNAARDSISISYGSNINADTLERVLMGLKGAKA